MLFVYFIVVAKCVGFWYLRYRYLCIFSPFIVGLGFDFFLPQIKLLEFDLYSWQNKQTNKINGPSGNLLLYWLPACPKVG